MATEPVNRPRCACRRGQSVSDYALAVGVIAATMSVMQPFFQRFVQAKLKEGVDGLLAISEADAQTGGKLTQRKGNDRRREGIPDGAGADTGVVATAPTESTRTVYEEAIGGRRVLTSTTAKPTESTSTVGGAVHARAFFRDVIRTPGQLLLKESGRPRSPLFVTKEEKERQARRTKREKHHKDLVKYHDEVSREMWEYVKDQARACYANDDKRCEQTLTRKIMEDPERFRRFAERYNRLRGLTPKKRGYLNPKDPAAAWAQVFDAPYADAAGGYSGPAYADPPASWFKEDGLVDVTQLSDAARWFLAGFNEVEVTDSPEAP